MGKITSSEYQQAVKRLNKVITRVPSKRDNTQPEQVSNNSPLKKDSSSKFLHKLFLGLKILRKQDVAVVASGLRHRVGISRLAMLSGMHFKRSKNPEVSIIIPVFNKTGLTIECLNSLAHHQTKYSFEVIIVDNASKEPLGLFLKNVGDIVFVRNPSNLGFVGGCNVGAAKARSSVVVFLNNDVIILNNWLDNLIDRLRNKEVGLIGSKLIYPTGELQEAGGIIFKDGTGHNFGKYQDSNDFRYNYALQVDYVSGASIAIRKKLFDRFGGFDSLYHPAYYEDTDLCFKVREAGLKVIYEPTSVAVHVEGGTAGTNLTTGFKKFQVINHKKFVNRWKKSLENHLDSEANIFLARTRLYKKRVLFIDNSVPEHDKDSGSVREWALLHILHDMGYFITFWAANLVATLPYTAQLQADEMEVVYGEKVSFDSIMSERFNCYDLVVIARPSVGIEFMDKSIASQHKAKIVYDTVDLQFLRLERQALVENNKLLAKQAIDWEVVERSLIEKSHYALVVSEVEKNLLNKLGHQNVKIISNIHQLTSLDHLPPFEDRHGLLFIGSFGHPPNADGIIWFCETIFPKLRHKIPNIELLIIGSNPTQEVKQLGKIKGVKVLGYVENVNPYFYSSRLFISPLRFGAGVKGKIGQSVSLGLPVVTTSIGAEGMGLQNKLDCLIADSEEEFEKSILHIYRDKNLWQMCQKNAQAVVRKNMSVEAATRGLKNITN